MITINRTLGLALIALAAGAVAFGYALHAEGEIDSARCTPTSYKKTIGHQFPSTLLSQAGNRAWARVEQPKNATNTIALAFDGETAVIGTGVQLVPATTTPSADPYFTFGRNTDMPYVGAVTGITDTGSTTVDVTECLY